MKTIYHKVRLSLKDRINFFFINTNDNLTYKKKKTRNFSYAYYQSATRIST